MSPQALRQQALPSQQPTVISSPRAYLRDARGRFAPRPKIVRIPRREVLFVISEMSDFVKAGGLGDVAAALPRAMRDYCDMRVLIPGYSCVLAQAKAIEVVGTVAAHAGLPECQLGMLELADGLPVYVLLCPALFERPGSPYVSALGSDWEDNAVRFATLSHAASEIAHGRAGLTWQPQLLHLNDWPTALAAGSLRWSGSGVPSVLTIHNLAYQGLFPVSQAAALGIPETARRDVEFFGKLSFLRTGIAYADHITTVSASYAAEITTTTHGCGLEPLLSRHAYAGRLSGIVNGIDESWDPATDPHLPAPFTLDRLQGKRANARSVRREFGLPDATGPLFAVVSRLVHQKGVDMICEIAPQIAAAGGQIVSIGCGETALERSLTALSRTYPGHISAYIGFEEALARRMFAGSDFLLMPSRFEPCGLSQMYAQRFGSLPIARATGGLIDTIDDGVTGFLFHQASTESLRRCVQRAFQVYRMPQLFNAMRRAAMLKPAGWQNAARQYHALYERAVATAAVA